MKNLAPMKSPRSKDPFAAEIACHDPYTFTTYWFWQRSWRPNASQPRREPVNKYVEDRDVEDAPAHVSEWKEHPVLVPAVIIMGILAAVLTCLM